MNERNIAPALTLENVTITWTARDDDRECDVERTLTGRELAYLIERAYLEKPAGVVPDGAAAFAAFKLRGLGDLVFPDPRDSDHLGGDTRAFIRDALGRIAADVEADGAADAKRFTVHLERGGVTAGRAPEAS